MILFVIKPILFALNIFKPNNSYLVLLLYCFFALHIWQAPLQCLQSQPQERDFPAFLSFTILLMAKKHALPTAESAIIVPIIGLILSASLPTYCIFTESLFLSGHPLQQTDDIIQTYNPNCLSITY